MFYEKQNSILISLRNLECLKTDLKTMFIPTQARRSFSAVILAYFLENIIDNAGHLIYICLYKTDSFHHTQW